MIRGVGDGPHGGYPTLPGGGEVLEMRGAVDGWIAATVEKQSPEANRLGRGLSDADRSSVTSSEPARVATRSPEAERSEVTFPETDRAVWTFLTGGPIYASAVFDGGTVYVGSGDGNVYALDAGSGAEVWRFPTGDAVDASPAVAGGLVFALNRAGVLHAVDARTGAPVWAFRTGGERRLDFWDFYLSDPLVHGSLIVFGSGDGHVYALDRANGVERWRYRTGAIVHGAPVADDSHIYVGDFAGVVHAVDATTGVPAWTYRVEGNEHFPRGELQRGPALRDGVLYVGSRDYHLYALATDDGRLLWRIREGNGWIIATPLIDGESVFFGASDGQRFYAAALATGTVRWSVPVRTRVFGSAVRVGDTVVFGGFNGQLTAVDPADGTVRWTFRTPASRANFATVYRDDGTLNDEMRKLYSSGAGREAEERILALGSIAGTPAVGAGLLFFASTEGVVYALDPNR